MAPEDLIQVVTGTITFYEADDHGCHTIVKNAGEAYLDAGDHAHLAANETSAPALNIVTYFAPPGGDAQDPHAEAGELSVLR